MRSGLRSHLLGLSSLAVIALPFALSGGCAASGNSAPGNKGAGGAGGNEAFEHLMNEVESGMSQVTDLLSGEFFQAVPLPQAMREWR